MAAIAMSNYQLGDLIGRGASGSVYRALNFLTGETVAIKSVSILSLSPTSLPDIMSEIDLLKNLNHPNIVKYKGFAQDKENLFIVLEYCENGSLQTILKKFGKFPESLVAVYISQVLEGLIYLHEQGVIHRDIKGANILTNKDGSVKLADFGVSSRAAAAQVENNEVVGSPYWMAPEVIEQSGASTASDIWSVGCVVVELMEGRPPYGDLAPMQALWRIVQDEAMRIPEGASPIVRDFLYHCFQKDPNLRITAKKLLRHPWMLSARKNLQTSPPPPSQPPSRTPSDSQPLRPSSMLRTNSGLKARTPSNEGHQGKQVVPAVKPGGIGKAKKPSTVYDEAIQRVQEWNEALNADPKALGTMRRIVPRAAKQRLSSGPDPSHARNIFAMPPLPSHSSADSLSAEPSTSTNPSPAQPGIIQKNMHLSNVLHRAKESTGEETWDDDFAADISLSKFQHKRVASIGEDEMDQQTLKPTRTSPLGQKVSEKPRIENSAVRAVSTASTSSLAVGKKKDLEDYSDMAFEEDEIDLASKLAQLKMKSKSRQGILHPDDLRKLKSPDLANPTSPRIETATPPPAVPIGSLFTPVKSLPPLPPRSTSGLSSPSLGIPPSPRISSRSPPSSRQNSLRNKSAPDQAVELHRYTEEDDEGYDDIIEGEQATIGAKSTGSLMLTRRSNRSWEDEGEVDETDPFADIEDDFEFGDDIEANILRDKRATLCASVSKAIEKLDPDTPAGELRETCDQLLQLLEDTPEMGLEEHFVTSHGMHAILEVLESRLSRDIMIRILKIVNLIVGVDVDMLESFCLIGGIPVIMPFVSKRHSDDTRLEASKFIQQLTRSPLTLQMFISCRGLKILVELLDEDYMINKTLVISAFEGIGSVFDLQSPTPRNDFCRMFVREGIIDPLSTALIAILKDTEINGEDIPSRAISVVLLFCQVAQADEKVRQAFASRTIMMRLLKACELLPRKLLATAIKAVKHLSTSPQLIEVLQNSNAMELLVSILGKHIRGSHANEICSHIFQTVYSMCRLNKNRQEEAASAGIVPLLKRVIQNKSPLKQFALPILCDLANAGKLSRRILWQNDGLKMYLDLLEDPYWRVSALDAILVWMQDETARVEDVLLGDEASESLVKCFVQASNTSFEGILDPFLKILKLSSAVTISIAHPPFFRRLAESLSAKSTKATAVARLNLLRITRVACEHHPDRASVVSRFSLATIVDNLAKQDEAILVRELAKEIYPSLLFGNDTAQAVIHEQEQGYTGGRKGISRSQTSLGFLGSGRPIASATSGGISREESMGARSGSAMSGNRPRPERELISSPRSERRTGTGGTTSTAGQGRGSTASGVGLGLGLGDRVKDSSNNLNLSMSRGSSSNVSSSKERDTGGAASERPQHRRQISRSQVSSVQWETDENGRIKSVRAPSRTT